MQGIVNAYRESGFLPSGRARATGLHDRHPLLGHPGGRLDEGHSGLGRRGRVEGIVKGAHADSVPLSSVGRLGAPWYDRLGYVPSDVGINESAARTLEYAFDDFCNWRSAGPRQARGRGREVRSAGPQLPKRLRCRHRLHARRRQDGSWQEPFRPDSWGGVFTEGSAWHWTWSVFHDPAGLATLFGGDDRMAGSSTRCSRRLRRTSTRTTGR